MLARPSESTIEPAAVNAIGQTAAGRPGERVVLWSTGILRPLLPAPCRAVAADAVARTPLAAALAQAPDFHLFESERIT